MEFHIECEAEDIARYVFVPGAHDRAKKIAAHFDDARLVSDSRGYMVYTGTVDGIPMTVCSTGMGGPQVAIGIEELGHLGADTFIRVGSCGTFQDDVTVGDLIVPNGIYRAGATADRYLPPAFPAAPDFAVLTALVEAAEDLGVKVHVGVGWSGDAFYAPGDPALMAKLKQAGVLSLEMESDTLFIVSNFRGWRAGAIFASDGTSTEIKPAWGEAAFRKGEELEIRIAIEAMKRIAKADLAAEGGGVMEFHIRCKPEDIARYVFTPGSHSRAKKIAAHFDDARLVSDSRGYLVYTGTVDGIRMTVSSTGMGGPTTAICLEELAHHGRGYVYPRGLVRHDAGLRGLR